MLRKFSFHDTGEHIAAHVLEHRVFGSACEKKKWYTLLVILTHLLVSALVSIANLLELGFGALSPHI